MFELNDSTVIQNSASDPPFPSILKQIQSGKDGKKFILSMISPVQGKISMILHIIDNRKGIAILERPNSTPELRYQLVVDGRKFRNFPMIVNYDPDDRTAEWKFDKIDYKKLLDLQ